MTARTRSGIALYEFLLRPNENMERLGSAADRGGGTSPGDERAGSGTLLARPLRTGAALFRFRLAWRRQKRPALAAANALPIRQCGCLRTLLCLSLGKGKLFLLLFPFPFLRGSALGTLCLFFLLAVVAADRACDGVQQVHDLALGHQLAEEEALSVVASKRPDIGEVFFAIDADGDQRPWPARVRWSARL